MSASPFFSQFHRILLHCHIFNHNQFFSLVFAPGHQTFARAQIFRGELGRAPGSAAEAAAAAELIVFTRDERVLRALQTTMGAIDAEQVCVRARPCHVDLLGIPHAIRRPCVTTLSFLRVALICDFDIMYQ